MSRPYDLETLNEMQLLALRDRRPDLTRDIEREFDVRDMRRREVAAWQEQGSEAAA